MAHTDFPGVTRICAKRGDVGIENVFVKDHNNLEENCTFKYGETVQNTSGNANITQNNYSE